jgi:two-component system chemotaxis response regulator CheY
MMEDPTPKTILVVDDEAHIVRVVAFKLRAAGFAVIEAFDGEEAWSCLRDAEVDLVLTDQQMPVLDGIGLARRIAGDPRFKGVPVLMLTARGFRLDPEEFAGSGIVEMLDKPFSPRVLLERIHANLADTTPRREAA